MRISDWSSDVCSSDLLDLSQGIWLLRKLNSNLLSVKEVDRAFPLIRTICPAAELEGWRRFALQCLAAGPDSGTGVLVVRNEQACIVGIAAFRLADDLVHGPVLVADTFCALDIFDQANVARTLENGLAEEEIGRASCRERVCQYV